METKLEELIMAPRSQRKEALEGLVIRPNLTGKKTIGNNFEDWLEDGGWNFLNDDGSEEEEGGEGREEEEEDGDPSAKCGSEEDDDSESSFDSGEDDSGFSDGEDDSDGSDLSEEGLSWDELDKMAEEEDRKANTRRVAAPVKK